MRKVIVGLLLSTLTLFARPALAGQIERKDLHIVKDVVTSVNRYVYFTVFDDVAADVTNGVVTLTGKVTLPFKRTDLANRVARVAGITGVINEIEVLPFSRFDDELRYRIARSIYGNSNFLDYAIMANPPIHIVVERGQVTLTGVVRSDVDRVLARSLAAQFGAFSVKNELKTDAEIRESLERS